MVALGAGALLRWPALTIVFRDPQSLRAFLDRQGPWAPLVFMSLQAAQVIVAPIPGHFLAVASGLLFGLWRGTLYSAIGVGSGSAIVLILARLFGRSIVRHLVRAEALQRIDVWATRHGPIFFFLFFMMPFLPDDLACFAVGLSSLPLLPLLALIILARLPGHFISAWIGATAERVPLAVWALILAGAAVVIALLWSRRESIERWLTRRVEQASAGWEETLRSSRARTRHEPPGRES